MQKITRKNKYRKQINNNLKKMIMETKKFGNKNGVIIEVNEALLSLDVIRQIRNYLNIKEKDLKKIATIK